MLHLIMCLVCMPVCATGMGIHYLNLAGIAEVEEEKKFDGCWISY